MPRDAEELQQLKYDMVYALSDAAPEGWQRIDLTCRVNVGVQDFTVTVLMADGGYAEIAVPQDAVRIAVRMRELFYEDGEGTWFSMRFIVDPPTRFRVVHNVEWDPRWAPSIDPLGWVADLEAFPRDPEHIPGWLRDKLAEAGHPVDAPPEAGHAGPLDADEQNEIWVRIANAVALAVPTDWAQVMLTYRAIGDYTELPVMVRRESDGGLQLWDLPEQVPGLLAELRAGMYRPGRGTWFQAVAHIPRDMSVEYEYTWDDQPSWDGEPPAAAFARELTAFPRETGMIPDWLNERLGTTGTAASGEQSDPETAAKEALDVAAELELDPSRYSVGETVDGAWCLVAEDGRWAVFQAQGTERGEEVVFDTAQKAVRYFVGHLYLNQAAFRGELPPDAKRPTEDWPIQPVGGDVGLQLYGGKRIATLPPGTEMDRYGRPDGNTLYAARTEFTHRSQPAEEQRFEYHVYRTVRPVRAIVGTPIAWYDQAGGGTAYVLERSVAELLADGSLVEVPQATTQPPPPQA